MSWKLFVPENTKRTNNVTSRILLNSLGVIKLSQDLVSKLDANNVQLLTNNSKHEFGLQGTKNNTGLKLTPQGRQKTVNINRLLVQFSKDCHKIKTSMTVPFRWDGKVLVIDISDVPNAGFPEHEHESTMYTEQETD